VRRLLLSPAAEQDLEEIEAYIATENPSAVEGVLDSLEAGCQLVADHPGVGRDRDEIENGVLSFPIGSYVLLLAPRRGHRRHRPHSPREPRSPYRLPRRLDSRIRHHRAPIFSSKIGARCIPG